MRKIKDLFRRRRAPETVPGSGYLLRLDTAGVIAHNTLMNGITSTRGEALGIIQEDLLRLEADGTFLLEKELKSTRSSLLMKDPIRVQYSFRGTYTRQGNRVFLSAAREGTGHVDWGTISKFLDTGNGDYDSATSPGILSLYPTSYFLENCKNVPMTVLLEERENRFTIEPFQPTILSPEAAGAVLSQREEIAPEAGLMKPLSVPGDHSLRETFARWGMKIGTCIGPEYLEPPYEAVLWEQFSSVTLENHLKPGHILDREASCRTGTVSVTFPEETVRLLDRCAEHDMPLRGHTLIWYMGTPEWLFHEDFAEDGPDVDRQTLLRRMEELIRGFFRALAQGGWDRQMYCVDVVNEAVIAPDRLRKCPWLDIIGEDYLLHAFRFARKYAPEHMKLCYNDFDLEAKTGRVIDLVRQLKDPEGKLLVDVIGQQGHYGAYSSIDTLSAALKKIGLETGCELQITELDVSVSRQGTDEELKRQGRFYYDFVQKLLELKAQGVEITGLTLWGFTDALSWMPSGFLHPYDRKLTPKYAYYGLLGMKEYAVFDDDEDTLAAPGVRLYLYCPGASARKIRLEPDGSYTDTLEDTLLRGSYRRDGDGFLTIPAVGGQGTLRPLPGGRWEHRQSAGKRTLLEPEEPHRDHELEERNV